MQYMTPQTMTPMTMTAMTVGVFIFGEVEKVKKVKG